jgi:peptidoglycan hydrolase-like protein with peptidoglycan-binding domain
VLSTGGLAVSTLVRSPAQLAAETAPPKPSVLTAEVEHRVLVRTLITRGVVAASHQVTVTPVTSTQGPAAQVLTALRTAVGKPVQPGEVLLEVSGRPLIALPGTVPFYRDLRPADEGADVRQLQSALRSLGLYEGGDTAGFFGERTKAAVRRLYADRGYRVADTGGPGGAGDKEALRDAENAVRAAQRAVDNLERQIRDGGSTSPAPGAEPLGAQLAFLRQQRDEAAAARAELIARTGPMVPAAEVLVLPSFPGRVVEILAKVGDPVREKLITVAAGTLGVGARLRPDQAQLLKVGMKVEMVAETLGAKATGVVASLGTMSTDSQGQPGGGQGNAGPAGNAGPGAPYVPVAIEPSDPLDAAWSGQDVRLTIASAQTAGPVLVVPLSAVSSAADGRTTVSKVVGPDQLVRVEVRAGMSGDGYVEVTPVNGDLAEGDVVVVGE